MYEVRGEPEIINRVMTLIVEIKLGHIFLAQLQRLPWDDLILFHSRAICKNHRETEEFMEKLDGGWYPLQVDSPDGSRDSTTSYTTDSAHHTTTAEPTPPLRPPAESPPPSL